MPAKLDLSGKMFGFWRVEYRAYGRYWRCTCTKCGKEKDVYGTNLTSGKSTGCKQCDETRTIHGHCTRILKSQTYNSWSAMLARCNNPKHTGFKWYGGKGIKVCERWLSFPNFLADMGEVPPGMWIERKDTNGDYCPENCKWATIDEQARNRSANRWVICNGKKMIATDAAKELGLVVVTVLSRLRANPDFYGDIATLTWRGRRIAVS